MIESGEIVTGTFRVLRKQTKDKVKGYRLIYVNPKNIVMQGAETNETWLPVDAIELKHGKLKKLK